MWVDDDIGAYSSGSEWHIFFGDDISYSTLLSMARRELISDDGFTRGANSDFCNTISVAIAVDEILVNV